MSGKIRCPSCDEANDEGNTYCRRCGSPLGQAPVRFEPAAGDDEDLGPVVDRDTTSGSPRGLLAHLGGTRARALLIVAASVGSVAVIGGLIANADWFSDAQLPAVAPTAVPTTPEPMQTPSSDPPSVPTAVPAPLDQGDITATATSTLESAGDVHYDVGLTLDGDPATAWNDGVDDDVGIGETLEYRFATPVVLDSLEILNGYHKVATSGEDLWMANARVADLTVATDTTSVAVTLLDSRDPQSVSVPDEGTCVVALTVDSVHPGSAYADVAISEVQFIGTPAPGSCDD